jgi:hypothetical protein
LLSPFAQSSERSVARFVGASCYTIDALGIS